MLTLPLQVAAAREAARREALNGANLNPEDIDVALPEANIIPHHGLAGRGQLPPGFAAMYDQFRLADLPRPFAPPVDPALLRARPIGPGALPEARAARAQDALAQAERLRDQLARLREARNADLRARAANAGRRGDAAAEREEMVRLLRRRLEERALPRPGNDERAFVFDRLAPYAPPQAGVRGPAEMDRQQRALDRAALFLDPAARHEEMLPAVERHLAAGPDAGRPAQAARQQPARAVRFQDAPIAPIVPRAAPDVAALEDYDEMRARLLRLAEMRLAIGRQAPDPLPGLIGRLPEARAPVAQANPVAREPIRPLGNVDQHFVSASFCQSRFPAN